MRYASTIVALVTAVVCATAARGQSAEDTSVTERIMAKSRRANEYLELMKSSDRAVQMEALEDALKEADPATRSLALETYLRRLAALNIEVSLPPGSRITRAQTPTLEVRDVAWQERSPNFHGRSNCDNDGVDGQVADGVLSLEYNKVCLNTSLLAEDDESSSTTQPKTVFRRCEVTLSNGSGGGVLEGPLYCEGMKTPLRVALHFGP